MFDNDLPNDELQEQVDAIDCEVTDLSDKYRDLLEDMADLYLMLIGEPNITQQTKDAIKKRFFITEDEKGK